MWAVKFSGFPLTFFAGWHIIKNRQRDVAKFGIALGSGPRGPGFESRHSDQKSAVFLRKQHFFFTFSSEKCYQK